MELRMSLTKEEIEIILRRRELERRRQEVVLKQRDCQQHEFVYIGYETWYDGSECIHCGKLEPYDNYQV